MSLVCVFARVCVCVCVCFFCELQKQGKNDKKNTINKNKIENISLFAVGESLIASYFSLMIEPLKQQFNLTDDQANYYLSIFPAGGTFSFCFHFIVFFIYLSKHNIMLVF